MSAKDDHLALPDYSHKRRSCDLTAKAAEDNNGDLKRQLAELTAQVGKIATRIDNFESWGPSSGKTKRSKDKNRCIAYLDKECMRIIEPWRRSPDEKTKDILKRCLLWFNEKLKANQNHQNTLQNGLDS
jgi:hypothetical protein